MHLNNKLYFLATKGRGKNLSKRPKPIQQFIDSMKRSEWSSFEQLRRSLYIALGYAGGDPPKGVLLSLLTAENTPPVILEFTLDAMANSRVPIRALPRLMELSDHPNKTSVTHHVGELTEEVTYPIREGVCDCLNALHITCEVRPRTKVIGEKELPLDDGKTHTMKIRKKTNHIHIDRSSLVDQIRTWLLSDDPSTWKPALEVVQKMKAEDVREMYERLKAKGQLSERKRSYEEQLD